MSKEEVYTGAVKILLLIFIFRIVLEMIISVITRYSTRSPLNQAKQPSKAEEFVSYRTFYIIYDLSGVLRTGNAGTSTQAGPRYAS